MLSHLVKMLDTKSSFQYGILIVPILSTCFCIFKNDGSLMYLLMCIKDQNEYINTRRSKI
jgi:hypothetical protein